MIFPFLTIEEIEQHAALTSHRAFEAGVARVFPFDIESTVEFLFEYRLNLAARLPRCVLGNVDSDKKVISVSEAIRVDGQRRFTVAHEVGHLVLHIPLLQAQRQQQTLFEMQTDIVPVQDKRMEFQADAFAASILMPREAVLTHFGDETQRGECVAPERVMDVFGVSRQAAMIRMKECGMILEAAPGQRLGM